MAQCCISSFFDYHNNHNLSPLALVAVGVVAGVVLHQKEQTKPQHSKLKAHSPVSNAICCCTKRCIFASCHIIQLVLYQKKSFETKITVL